MRNIFIIAGAVLKELVRRKDIYMIFALFVVILFYSSVLSFGGETGFQRYFKEIGISFTCIFSIIIAVTFASRQIPQETEARTVYYILSRPVSRAQFIMGKFLGVLFVSAVSFLIFYLTFVISILLRNDTSTPAILFVQGFLLHLLLLSFFVSLSIFLSLFLSTAANSVILLIFYFGTNWFGATFPAYIYLPHPELFDIKEKIVHTWDAVPSWVMFFLTLYAVIYITLFLASACVVFRKRNL